jgi:cytochrome c556
MKAIRFVIVVCALAVIVGLAFMQGSAAQPDDKVRGDVEKIAAAVKKGDMDGARKLAAGFAKKYPGDALAVLEDTAVMDLFKKKDKGGIGFGAGPKATDGIEEKFRELAKGIVNIKDAELYEKMAYNTIAIGLIAEALEPKTDKLDWKQYTKDMLEGTEAFAKAAKAKNAANLKTTGSKVNDTCIGCHAKFRNKQFGQ